MISKKDFKEIANVIAESDVITSPIHNPQSVSLDRSVLIVKLCKVFEKSNPKFDKERFIDACNVY